MKARNLFRPLTFILLLAFLLILTGTVCGIRTFEMLEKLALRYEENEVLMESLRATVLYTVLSGSMLVSGVGIFLVCCPSFCIPKSCVGRRWVSASKGYHKASTP